MPVGAPRADGLAANVALDAVETLAISRDASSTHPCFPKNGMLAKRVG